MYTHGRKHGCRISLDYTYRGMQVAYLENELIRVGVLVSKGGDIFELTHKPHDVDLMWQSPLPLRKPFVATSALPEGNFHDYYFGGWQEVLPSAGWASEAHQGASQGLHGEVALLPFEASIVEDSADVVSLKMSASLYRSPLTLEKTLTLNRDESVLRIHERLTNDAPVEFDIMWGHHPAFGEPFLDDSCRAQIPAGKVEALAFHENGQWEPSVESDAPNLLNRRSGETEDVTRIGSPESNSVDVLFFKELEAGWYALTNQRQKLGFGMSWDASLFRYVWMWQNWGGHTDYPWYGRAYTCAIEPFTSYPPAGIANAVRNGTALTLQPGQVIETDLTAVVYEGEGVQRITPDGQVEV